ncbi:response regulator [Pedobacter riviphilus]|uniref:histidine kinase n=1 Tax=Pedobacter riviphilus TaxID=2766984 RepID=A0ABX6TFJ9_9SPHI|nr:MULTISPECIES: response regulator [Pedobacter]NII84465.1 signal transduction histidine kinase/DNA-binding response OmpR family regulator/CHASE3 domain sensor protein [Pedobacter sp. SG908]NMN38620.1 signal transduction histidine kinase/DNA-binding response OmpR family regulator/CHASE3 domain sensor protein [Pedobacter sp. SG918]QNR84284.1 response regulator [Pedobacter riviphilus]
MKTTLKNNLRLGLGLSLIILFISSLASYISIGNLIKSTELVKKSDEVILNAENIISYLKDAETGQRGFLLTGNKVFLTPYYGANDSAALILKKVELDTKDNSVQQKNVAALKNILFKRMDIIKSTIEIKTLGGVIDPTVLFQGKLYMDEAREIVSKMVVEEKRLLEERTNELNKLTSYTPILILIAALLAILITLFFYRRVSIDFDERVKLQQEIEDKKTEMEKRIIAIKEIAYQISSGNYGVKLDSQTADDIGELSDSLNTMSLSLKKSFDTLAENEWLQTGVANLNVKMVGEKDVFHLAEDIIAFLANYTKSQVGAIYLFKDDGYLHLKGQYALRGQNLLQTIELGQGLIGQAVKSGKPILLDDVPQNELTITHATGNIKPAQVIVLPIIRNEISIGGLELGTIGKYSDLQLHFLNLVSSDVGTALLGAQNRQKLQQLLEETQAQSEELQVQHSELEGLNAELEAQAQKLQASEEELRVQQEELLQSNQELEERSSLLEEKNELIEERNIEIQQKAEALELSTRYKSEFLANMSHELRTPLNSILLLSRLMAENEAMDREHQEYAEVIQSSGQGLLSLIDEILDLSKIEAGKMELDRTNIKVDEVIFNMRSLFNPLAKEKNLNFVIEKSPEVPEFFHTDKMRLEQIIKNLLSNAIKFTAAGAVTLNINKNEKLGALVFKVTDTGVGIAPEKQGMVFEAFQQADGSTRRKFGGTGLGLSISRELAKLLGGYIDLKSTEGEGSIFTLTLPIDRNKGFDGIVPSVDQPIIALEAPVKKVSHLTVDNIPQEVEDDRDNIQPDDKVILIVEDDTPFAKTLLDFTRKRNYKGLVAVRGDAGIEMAKTFKPLAILLDIQLPVKDGWQVMEELKSDPSTRPIPVHIMSSLQVKKESLLKGAVDFINKPFAFEHMQEIFSKLEHALSRHPKKVLIVEENEQHAKALSYFLSNFNIQTEIVNQVKESVSALHKPEVNCVILDMGIPDKHAYDTLEVVKKTPGLENLPIIIFTGKNLSKGEENRIKQYADSIVVKTAHSYQRILDEAGLFLHLVEEKSKEKIKTPKKFSELQDVLVGKTVLVADDDVRNIFSLTKMLEQHQMKVIAATDGKEALKLLNENPGIDVVLMDMMMPELDGYETTTAIRQDIKYRNLPILAVTAKAMMGDREKCIAAGASDYISKPVDMDQLISLLRVWLYENHHKS